MTENIRRTAIRTADTLANEKGFNNAEEFIHDIRGRMSSNDPVVKSIAERIAGDFTSKLTLLTLYQTIDANYNLRPYAWVNRFETTKLEAGNSKQFIRDILTGVDDYDETKFVPTSSTEPQVDEHTISFFATNTTASSDRTLTPWAKQIKRPLTLKRERWIPYFMNGNLQKFISSITNQIQHSVFMGRYKVLQNLFTKLKTGTNSQGNNEGMYQIINNPAGVNNILDVFTKVVFPNIMEMQFLNNKYNIGKIQGTGNSQQNTTLNSTDPSEVLIFINNKTYTKLTTGVLSQVFNNKLLEISNWVPRENIIPVSTQLNVGSANTAVGLGNDQLVGENEIVVISKSAIKGLLMVDTQESQAWAENMTLQLVAHAWVAYGVLPWAQGFVVRTPALTVMPSNPQGN